MTTLPHMIWLRSFEAAARLGSFTNAAQELNLTPAAISQQIRLLEQHLGAPLFTRLPRGVALTDIGHAYAQPIRKSFTDMQEATNGLFARPAKRPLRIRASISFATLVLAPRLGAFQKDHPDIDLQVSTSVWTPAAGKEPVDLEIRYGHGDWAERDIRPLGHRFGILVCTPDLARGLAPSDGFDKLAEQAIHIIGSETDWGQMATLLGRPYPHTPPIMKVDSSLMALQVLTTGSGAVIVAEDFARDFLDRGHVICPLPHRLPLSRSFYAVAPDHNNTNPDVQTFCGWLLQSINPDESPDNLP
ncbi:LysR substrate-binding domain-containing protein [Aliiroseovarius crassostreae]|uniref:LysR substrate-binding domain-containing protein n=1 Tax=Aliiroseovarius crassostreae TaxID=154981 RepID=UPI0021FB0E1B|nr:LysR substrate-binding domain-containing protein [Aliiroseovarius crassostreae]UWP88782.1 LysR family transcriptional regulator [Aliiroseovarius crassostreae]UWQ01435.1 LysR family transcriptional regulator [Aliiroseovarius crassostreae]